MLSPGHLHWVLVTHQCGGPPSQLSQEGWPLLGRWHRMVAPRKGHLRWPKRATPPAAGDFQGKEEVGKGVMEAEVSVWVERDPRGSVAVLLDS